MSGDPVLTQLPTRDTLGVPSEGIHLPCQPLQTMETPVFKSNSNHRGNRPHGGDGFPLNTSQVWGPNHRNHTNTNQNRGHHPRNGNGRGAPNNISNSSYIANTSNKGNKGNRIHNAQAQGHQHHPSLQYKRQDFSAQNNATGQFHSSYHSNLPNSVENQRRHSNDGCTVLPNAHHGQPIPGIVQPEAHSYSSVPLLRAPSYETGTQQSMSYSKQGPLHPRAASDMACIHDNHMHHHFLHPSLDTSEPNCNSQPRILPNSRPAPPSELVIQQPAYGVPWGYHPPHVPPMVPQGIPMSTQQPISQGQADMGSTHQPPALQNETLSMSAGAHAQGKNV